MHGSACEDLDLLIVQYTHVNRIRPSCSCEHNVQRIAIRADDARRLRLLL
jgi:hypothetical protein